MFAFVISVLFGVASPTSLATHEIDSRIRGELDRFPENQFFVLHFQERPIGQLVINKSWDKEQELVVFSSTLEYRLIQNETTRVTEVQIFESDWPYRLSRADYKIQQPGFAKTHKIRIVGSHLVGENRLRSAFGLFDAFAFQFTRYSQNKIVNKKTINYGKADVDSSGWLVSDGLNGFGQRNLTNVATQAISTIDADGMMASSRSTFGIHYQRVTSEQDLPSWLDQPPLLPGPEFSIPLNIPLDFPQRLTYLKLQVESEHGDLGPWTSMLEGGSEFASSSVVPIDVDVPLGGTAPVEPPVAALFATLELNTVDKIELIEALINFVNGFIDYHEFIAQPDVDSIIENRRGNCSDYALLFNHLANAAGLYSQSVSGFVYRSDSQSFRIHAWNRVAVNDSWIHVDPTWRQNPADATHIPFPSDNVLEVLTHMPKIGFRLVESRVGEDDVM